MTDYDPKVIQKFADRLYTRAAMVIVWFVILGLLSGLVTGWLLGLKIPLTDAVKFLIFPLLGALVSWGWAEQKAFQLRLEAQKLLLQKRIEENTAALIKK